MASVGLLYVGAVLILNGLMLLGLVDARAAAPLNLFVGALQVLTPTYLIFTSGGEAARFLPVLRAGEILHLGKNTAAGCGRPAGPAAWAWRTASPSPGR